MSAARRDRRRTDIAKFIETVNSMRVPPGSPNEQAIWIILARHGTKEGATRACRALWERFLSVNEFRVANVTEIAELIEPHVKNDPIVAAEQARGYLRQYFKEFQMVDPAATADRTPDQLRKYLNSLDGFAREIALAQALYYCQREVEEQAGYAELEGDGKLKKRPEREITAAAKRLRLLFAFAAYVTVTAKTAQTNASRAFVKAWAYAPLPKPEADKPARKKTAKKAVSPKAPKEATAKKGAGKARPKTTRTTRKHTTAKKSSRR